MTEQTRIITVAAGKGGSCKSTIATSLAVLASKLGKTALIDLNSDQANASQWWVDRGKPDNPILLHDFTNLKTYLDDLREDGTYDWIIIDTPPVGADIIEGSILVADAVMLPSRAGIFDLDQVDTILQTCQRHHVPVLVGISARDNQRLRKMTEEVEQYLREAVADYPVAHLLVHAKDVGAIGGTNYRAEYVNSLTVGKSAFETDKEARKEIQSIWDQIQAVMP